MNGLATGIAARHLLARKRQSLVSLLGIILGVAFFLSISSLMQGSEDDFIRRLIDNAPHITIVDQFRVPNLQPLMAAFPHGAIEVKRVKPETETRGIRGYKQILQYLAEFPGLSASPVLSGQALINFAGKDVGIALNGMLPADIERVTTIGKYMVVGKIMDLAANTNGIIIGDQLASDLSISMGQNLSVATTEGENHTFKVIGLFHTGRADYDEKQGFVELKRVQSLFNRANRANNIIIKLRDPNSAQSVAAEIEGEVHYKSISWQEASVDIMSLLLIRKIVMYTVVSAVLVVAAFGIYNVISTVVMEKQRDIAILKSMGFRADDVLSVFLVQGIILGLIGSSIGLPLGVGLMLALGDISFKTPGSTDIIYMPMAWNWFQFTMAACFAIVAAVLAAFIPARKASRVDPVDILRGGT